MYANRGLQGILKKQYEEAQQEINALKTLAQPAPIAPMAPASDEATIEAEVTRRIAALPPANNSASIEAEVTRRLAEIQANQPAQLSAEPIDHTAAIERRLPDELPISMQARPYRTLSPHNPWIILLPSKLK